MCLKISALHRHEIVAGIFKNQIRRFQPVAVCSFFVIDSEGTKTDCGFTAQLINAKPGEGLFVRQQDSGFCHIQEQLIIVEPASGNTSDAAVNKNYLFIFVSVFARIIGYSMVEGPLNRLIWYPRVRVANAPMQVILIKGYVEDFFKTKPGLEIARFALAYTCLVSAGGRAGIQRIRPVFVLAWTVFERDRDFLGYVPKFLDAFGVFMVSVWAPRLVVLASPIRRYFVTVFSTKHYRGGAIKTWADHVGSLASRNAGVLSCCQHSFWLSRNAGLVHALTLLILACPALRAPGKHLILNKPPLSSGLVIAGRYPNGC